MLKTKTNNLKQDSSKISYSYDIIIEITVWQAVWFFMRQVDFYMAVIGGFKNRGVVPDNLGFLDRGAPDIDRGILYRND